MKKIGKILILTGIIIIILIAGTILVKVLIDTFGEKRKEGYFASSENKIELYSEEYTLQTHVIRGTKTTIYEKKYKQDEIEYQKVKYKGKNYYVKSENITDNKDKIIHEKEVYVRTPAVIYYKVDDPSIMTSAKKGQSLQVLGYHTMDAEGNVDLYKVAYGGKQGYIYAKYVVLTEAEALQSYNENGVYDLHKVREDRYGGGSAGNLDYYPQEKPQFKGNTMPKEARTLYINTSAVKRIDDYIDFAKKNNINALVIDIKENTLPGYASPVMSELSPGNYKKAVNTFSEYKTYVSKAKDNGLYVIGRISTFKDQYYAVDHPENTILDTRNNKPFAHNNTYWPTAFNRDVWEYNVKLAIEAVTKIGFQEIQFDYVRFPDKTSNLEKSGVMDLRNTYKEEKASAIQQFLMYARDELHKVGAYISADVFGETASDYVTAYGQYWPAISNVVDVISAMPYPDHFNKNEYGITVPVWTVPYQLLKTWGTQATLRQKEIPSPAHARTWIQAYNTIQEPFIVYDASKVSDQIKGLYEAGLTGGYITWHSGSSLDKYKQLATAFKKEYINE